MAYFIYLFLFYMTPEVSHRRAPTFHKHGGPRERCFLELYSEQGVWPFQAAICSYVPESSR